VGFISRAQIIVAFGALGLALFVLDLVRRRKLAEEFSLLWVMATLVMAALGFFTPLLRFITRALGILFESSTVFAVGLAFTTAALLYLSVRMSRLSQEHQTVIRELALLRQRLEEGRPPDPAERA
jgi:hypothetical protein